MLNQKEGWMGHQVPRSFPVGQVLLNLYAPLHSFQTKKGQLVYANPGDAWVKEYIRNLKRPERKSQIHSVDWRAGIRARRMASTTPYLFYGSKPYLPLTKLWSLPYLNFYLFELFHLYYMFVVLNCFLLKFSSKKSHSTQ